MHAWVAGATGYTGQAVVRALRARLIDTTAHVRPDSSELGRWRGHFAAIGAEVDCTPWETDALAARLGEVKPTLVFALVGTTRARRRRSTAPEQENYEQVDHDLTRMLLDASAGLPTPPRFVYLSAMGTTPDSRSAYGRARARIEAALGQGDMPHVIARPGFIAGPDRTERRTMERFAAASSDLLLAGVAALGGGKLQNRFASMTGAALGTALVRLATESGVTNQTFETADLRKYAGPA